MDLITILIIIIAVLFSGLITIAVIYSQIEDKKKEIKKPNSIKEISKKV